MERWIEKNNFQLKSSVSLPASSPSSASIISNNSDSIQFVSYFLFLLLNFNTKPFFQIYLFITYQIYFQIDLDFTEQFGEKSLMLFQSWDCKIKKIIEYLLKNNNKHRLEEVQLMLTSNGGKQ